MTIMKKMWAKFASPRVRLTLNPDSIRVETDDRDVALSARLALHVGSDRVPKIVAVGDDVDELPKEIGAHGLEHDGHIDRVRAAAEAPWLSRLERAPNSRVAAQHVGDVVIVRPSTGGRAFRFLWSSLVHYGVVTSILHLKPWRRLRPRITVQISHAWADTVELETVLDAVSTDGWQFEPGSVYAERRQSSRWLRRAASALQIASVGGVFATPLLVKRFGAAKVGELLGLAAAFACLGAASFLRRRARKAVFPNAAE